MVPTICMFENVVDLLISHKTDLKFNYTQNNVSIHKKYIFTTNFVHSIIKKTIPQKLKVKYD